MEKRKEKLSFRDKMKVKAIRATQKIAVAKAIRNMEQLGEKHRVFIEEMQSKTADLVELEPENLQGSIIAMVCANLIQGFDTKEEMDIVVDMIKTTINEYWKNDDIPQKKNNSTELKNLFGA